MNRAEAIHSNLSTASQAKPDTRPVLLCLSHLRWGFVYQRPQHIMSRMARDYDVLFFEEPVFADSPDSRLEASLQPSGVTVLVPHLPRDLPPGQVVLAQRQLLDHWLEQHPSNDLLLWYFTPMSLAFTDHLWPQAIIYDCMDELSAFKGAPPELIDMEQYLLECADVVFTGGHSLWEAKKQRHDNVHAMPSSVDIEHFATARRGLSDPPDQQGIPRPRLGFFGVIDERFDIELIRQVASARPDWQIVLIGPVVKIDPDSLPPLPNIYYLGGKSYDDLPAYLSGWDVALMPFAINESTRFISPTKTPEYLAGGCPVVSTPITDVINTYGDSGVVTIAADAAQFCDAIERALARGKSSEFYDRADAVLADKSWDKTCAAMKEQIQCLK
ncbi:glycosyltransferase family 1 protein [Pseudomonas viridiflava]|uniref:glycosyltransferase family 1 protein n=1 Tax=Pseudomonas viridiflava TaxID=33069 RepID=UPI001C3176DC|nr:glycosyltransferase family 1 protein [Pseudomonas viridiflava]QXG27085.1 glycosyltransferase family 1 protein [Pseudomonas viridiflava]